MINVRGMVLKEAGNKDLPRLPWLLAKFPETVIVRSVAFVDALVTEFIRKPYLLVEEENHFVLYGMEIITNKSARFRVTDVDGEQNVLQYSNCRYPKWGDCPLESRLLIPYSLKLSEIGLVTL